jgi:hypothetical protein
MLLSTVVLLVGLVNSAAATTFYWTANGGDQYWCTAQNWNPVGIPGPTDDVILDNPDPCCWIYCDATCHNLTVGLNNGPCVLFIESGNVVVKGDFIIGDNAGSEGIVYKEGGTLSVLGNSTYGNHGKGTFNKNGGDVYVDGHLEIGAEWGGSGYARLSDGGVINTHTFGMCTYGGTGKMEICSDSFTVVVDGDVVTKIEEYIASGWIKCLAEKCCNSPVVDYDNEYPGRTAVYCVADPILAWNPSPVDDDNCVEQNAILSWQAGIVAVSHDVYLGTVFNDVSNATTASPEYKGRQASTTYNPGTLVPCTTYYWRIDEVNDLNVAWKGCIWTFETCCCEEALDPSPADYSDCVDPNVVLAWWPGLYSISHDVYFGTDFNDVNNATTFSGEYKGRQGVCTYDPPGVLAPKTWYYWRIDEICEGGYIIKGGIWRFRTGPCCVDPPASIVAWWPLDETVGTVSDELVNNNDGTWIGSPTPVVTGKVRGALSFNGVTDYVQVPNNASLNFGTGDLSIDAWIMTGDQNSMTIVAKQTQSPRIGYALSLSGVNLRFQLADGVGAFSYTNYTTSLTININQWNHVAVTVDRDDPNGLKLYINGLSETFNPWQRQESLTNDGDLLIAASCLSTSYRFNGAIDEVELYNEALDANDILAIFNADTYGKCEPCPNEVTPSVTYDVVSDWNLGDFNSVKTGDDCNGCLMLLDPNDPCAATPFPYAWIPNSSEGTISKVNVLTGNEEARYYTGPPDGDGSYDYLSPSRTTLDKYGNCWVANRSHNPPPGKQGSVTKILLNPPAGNTSGDLDQNGVIVNTLFSLDELLPWGKDVAVERHYIVGGDGTGIVPDNVPRAIAVDHKGYLWVGLDFGQRCVKLDPDQPSPDLPPQKSFSPVINPLLQTYPYPINAPRPTEVSSVSTPGLRPYGMALSPNGRLYVSSRYSAWGMVAEIDPVNASLCQIHSMKTIYPTNTPRPYGITVDQNCIVWMADLDGFQAGVPGGRCIRWDPAQQGASAFTLGTGVNSSSGQCFGITAHPDGKIWMTCWYNRVVRFNPGPAPVAGVGDNFTITDIFRPLGIGVGSDGDIIVSPYSADTDGKYKWIKMDSTTGAKIALPGVGQGEVGALPYVYSDFTGNLQNQAQQQGFWTIIFNSEQLGEKWGKAWWESIVPTNTSVSIGVRAANTEKDLAGLYLEVKQGENFEDKGIVGQYIQVCVQLSRHRPLMGDCNSPFGCGEMPASPKLCWLKVQAACQSCWVVCPNDIEVDCNTHDPDGAYVSYDNPYWDGDCNEMLPLTCDPPKGWFPVGVTPVTCNGQGPDGSPVKCTFNVTVKPCPDANGACCYTTWTREGKVWNCQSMTREDCNNRYKGVYWGDGQPCPNDVNDCNCVHPPTNAVAWWPLDEQHGPTATDIAGVDNKGTYMGDPAPIPAPGKLAYGLSFSGNGDYALVADHPEIDFGLGDLTIDAWVKTDSSETILPIVEKMTNVELAQGYSFFLMFGKLAFAVGDSSQPGYVICIAPGPDITDDNWHHVAVTFDRSIPDLKLYVDGEVVATGTELQISGSLSNDADLYIGRSVAVTGSDTFLTGMLDEIEMFKRVLTHDEIRNLYERKLGKCKETAYVTQSSPCCYYANTGVTTPGSLQVRICNFRDTEQEYRWYLQGITNSTVGCDTEGASLGPGTVIVPAGQCISFDIQLSCPYGMYPGDKACSALTVRNYATYTLISDVVKLIYTSKWCGWPSKFDTMPLTYPGEVRRIVFELTNTDDPCGVLPYKIEARDSAGNLAEAIILNGLPPGTAVEGVIEAEPNGTVQVTVDVELAEYQAFDAYDIVLLADSDGDGNKEDLLSATGTGIPCGANHYRFLAGDLDENCLVNLMDFAKLASDWLAEPQNPEWDIGMPPDNVINYRDIDRLVDSWLEMGMRP